MNITRSNTDTTRTASLTVELATLQGPCVGCTDCNGLCAELIDALMIPDIILSKKRETQ